MTRHNLDPHLSWLFSSKSYLPDDKDAQPLPLNPSIPSITASQGITTPLAASVTARGSLPTPSYSRISAAPAPPIATSVRPTVLRNQQARAPDEEELKHSQEVDFLDSEMARLQAPSRPRHKATLLSTKKTPKASTPVISNCLKIFEPDTRSPVRPGQSSAMTNRHILSSNAKNDQSNTNRRERPAPQPIPMDVDVFDLTTDEERPQTASSSTFSAFGSSKLVWNVESASQGLLQPRGQKRKSGELSEDRAGTPDELVGHAMGDFPRERLSSSGNDAAASLKSVNDVLSPPVSSNDPKRFSAEETYHEENSMNFECQTSAFRESSKGKVAAYDRTNPPVTQRSFLQRQMSPDPDAFGTQDTIKPPLARKRIKSPIVDGPTSPPRVEEDEPSQFRPRKVIDDSEDDFGIDGDLESMECEPCDFRPVKQSLSFGASILQTTPDPDGPGKSTNPISPYASPRKAPKPSHTSAMISTRDLQPSVASPKPIITASPFQADSPIKSPHQVPTISSTREVDAQKILASRGQILETRSSLNGEIESVKRLLKVEEDDIALDDLIEKRKSLRALEKACNGLLELSAEHDRLQSSRTDLGNRLLEAMDSGQSISFIQAEREGVNKALRNLEGKCCTIISSCNGDELPRRLTTTYTQHHPTYVVPQSPHRNFDDPASKSPSLAQSSGARRTQVIQQTQLLMSTPSHRQGPNSGTRSIMETQPPPPSVSQVYTPSGRGTSARSEQHDSYSRHPTAEYIEPSRFSSHLPPPPLQQRRRPVTPHRESPPPFTRRMGTPDEYGLADDDEADLMAFEPSFDFPQPSPPRSTTRGIFQETSGNRLTRTVEPKTLATPRESDNTGAVDSRLMSFAWSKDVKSGLHSIFRLKGFRRHQLEAINATLGGKDAFILMPTGGGKSLCYQLPATIRSGKTQGVTIVISPLLSLMQDQVEHLRKIGVQAMMYNGDISAEERQIINDGLKERNVEDFISVLYITPEMIVKSRGMLTTLESLHRRKKLARIVIDEAHCVSQWGHDFRPDYKALGDLRNRFVGVPMMALTATATENVKIDVLHNLKMEGCEVFNQSFNRANLYYEIRAKAKPKELSEEFVRLITVTHKNQTGIVYCFSRKDCETLAETLKKSHVKANFYHAGMDSAARSKVQKDWQSGQLQVIVATIAFGMGIDKASVRFVIHHTIPSSLEGYYQETGRAGRDGKRSHCYLFYNFTDSIKIKRMIDKSGDSSREMKDRQHLLLRNVVQYCDNTADCRRVQILAYFNEKFSKDNCNANCDVCTSSAVYETRDFSSEALTALRIVQEVQSRDVTLAHCIDIFAGKKTPKIRNLSHHELELFAAGSNLDRSDGQRLFHRLLSEDALAIDNEVNPRSGFPNSWIRIGPHAEHFRTGRRKIKLLVLAGSVRPHKKAPASSSRSEYPQSTNVSSPVQRMTKRRKADPKKKAPAIEDIEDDLEGFVVPDGEATTDDDGDHHCEQAAKPSRRKGKYTARDDTGPPIVKDSRMAPLPEMHQILVDEFLWRAEETGEDIRSDKSLRQAPFSATILREMAIRWTESIVDMKKIPGIDRNMVDLYGAPFIKLVKETHKHYENMNPDREDEPLDPHQHNVINIASDDEELEPPPTHHQEDEYGYQTSDLEDFYETGDASAADTRRSHFFAPPAKTSKVDDFNRRMQSATQKADSKTPRKTSKESNYRGKSRAPQGKAKPFNNWSKPPYMRKSGSGGSGSTRAKKTTSNSRGNKSGGRSKFVSNLDGGGGRSGSGSGGGGIPMMPT